MKIALTGPHGVGKTTLLELVEKDPMFADYTIIKEITRDLLKQGLPINEQGDAVTQCFIMSAHLRNTIYPNSFMDRCVIDGFIYTHYLERKNRVPNWVTNFAVNIYTECIEKYDLIFYIRPEFSIEEDGVRSISTDFQEEISTDFENEIRFLIETRKFINIHILTGTVENRYLNMKQIINNYESKQPTTK